MRAPTILTLAPSAAGRPMLVSFTIHCHYYGTLGEEDFRLADHFARHPMADRLRPGCGLGLGSGSGRSFGTVTDQSGGALAGAAVSAKNLGTGAERRRGRGCRGALPFSSLPVGQYEIRSGKAGFAEVVRTGVRLAVGQSATVDMELPVGESSRQSP